jgi:hypothetical protein
MKLTPMKFYWTMLIVITIAFTFSLFANPTTNDTRTPDTSEYIASSSSNNNTNSNVGDIVRPQENERGSWEVWAWKQNTQTVQLKWETIPTEKDNTWVAWGTRITQTEDEHVKQWNGSMYAIDIVTESWHAYFPKKYQEYFIVHIGSDSRIWNYIIIRHGNERWVYWHTVTSRSKWEYVQSTWANNILWQSNKSWLSTAKHIHIEKWLCPDKESKMKDCQNVSSTGQVAERNNALKAQRGWVTEKVSLWVSRGKEEVKNSERKSVSVSGSEVKVIACLNEKNMTIHPAKNSGSTGCFLGNGWAWKNIMLPPQKDLDIVQGNILRWL